MYQVVFALRQTTGAGMLGESDVVEGRVGYCPSPNTEAGVSGLYASDGSQTGAVGVYGLVRYPDPIKIPNPLAAMGGPAEFDAVGYAGVTYTFDIDDTRGGTGWFAGGIIEDLLVIEVEDRSDRLAEDQRVMMGVRIELP